MHHTIIAVADAARARMFSLERSDEPGGLHESLTELVDLINPARRRTPEQLFSDTRTNTGRTGGRFYEGDDHRAAHLDEIDQAFAREIAARIETILRDQRARRLIMCASPRMLGMLRASDLRRLDVVIVELAHDYTKLTPVQLQAELVDRGLLPKPPARVGFSAR